MRSTILAAMSALRVVQTDAAPKAIGYVLCDLSMLHALLHRVCCISLSISSVASALHRPAAPNIAALTPKPLLRMAWRL